MSAAALRSAVVATLAADPGILALAGPSRVHDGVPRGAALPYLAVGAIETRLLVADAGEGEVHRVEILAFSRRPARGEVAGLIVAARDALAAGTGLAARLAGHRLVNLAGSEMTSERQADGRTWRARLRLRVVTEPV
jgi:hypothetical protein